MRDDSGKYTPYIEFTLDLESGYEVRAAYEKSIRRKDPYLSPHTMFAGLRNDFNVIQFLKDFGPLQRQGFSLPDKSLRILRRARPKPEVQWLNLHDFWRQQKKYRAVTRLWEALPNGDRLIEALSEGYSSLRDSYLEVAGLHSLIAEARRTGRPHPLGWTARPETSMDEWFASVPEGELCRMVPSVIETELQSAAVGKPRWYMETRRDSRPAFRLGIDSESLWVAMWEFFAHDTYNGIIWRTCPHCGKVFRPARKDRFYCTPKLQQLHSKREWWNRNRRRIARPKHERS